MNSIFLILCTLVIYFFGYRYFARYLQRVVFRISTTAGPDQAPSTSIVERLKKAPTERTELLGFHFATITGLTTVSGASVAIYWGWIPAYLWLLVASSVAAGSFAIGSLWLRRKTMESDADTGAGTGLALMVNSHLPVRLAPVFLAMLALSLAAFAGLFVYFAAILLVSFPSISWPLLAILVLVGLLSRVIANQPAMLASRGITYLVAMIVVLLSIWISKGQTIGFSGSLNFDLSGGSLLSLDGIAVWGVLVLLFSLFVQRQPFEDWQKNFGVMSAILTVLMLLAFFIGMAVDHPAMSAPAFTGNKSPGLLPWLFISLTTGAYAGLHFLFAYSVTAPRMQADTDARFIGYGAALLEGLLVLSVILVFGVVLGSKEVWTGLYQEWALLPDGSAMLGHYVNGVIRATGHLGIGAGFAETWTALTMACLSMVSAIALLRVLRVLLQELGVRYRVDRLGTVKSASWVGFGLLLLAVLLINGSHDIKTLERLLGSYQYLLASIGLLAVVNVLVERQHLALPAWILLGITVLLSLMASGAVVWSWLDDVISLRLLTGLAMMVLQLALVATIGLNLWKKHRPPVAASPTEPPEN